MLIPKVNFGWVSKLLLLTIIALSKRDVEAQTALSSGSTVTDAITASAQDRSWTFAAQQGDSLFLRASKTSGGNTFALRLRVFDANGNLVGVASGANTAAGSARLDYRSPAAGTFTVRVDSALQGGVGNFRLDFLKNPGESVLPSGETGGPLSSEGRHEGSIAVGDLDAWTFDAAPGDLVELRLAQLSGGTTFVPRMQVFDAAGTLVASAAGTASGSSEARISFNPAVSNVFTLVVDSSTPEGTGNYRLHMVRLPGTVVTPASDTGESLTNGGNHDGSISLGDIDAWTFQADSGDRIFLRAGRSAGTTLVPRLRVFDAAGLMVGYAETTATEARVEFSSPSAGVFTVLVDAATAENTGAYRLFYLNLPGAVPTPSGDDGAELGAGNNDGTTGVGDLDVWTFNATEGDQVTLTITRQSGADPYFPRIRFYDATGALAGYVQAAATPASLTNVVKSTGVYSVVVDSGGAGGSGTYRINFRRDAGPINVPPPSGTPLSNAGSHEGTVSFQAEDSWTFEATAGDTVTLRAARLTGNTSWFRPWVRLYKPGGSLIASGNVTDDQDNGVTVVIGESGTYRVSIKGYYENYEGTYRLHYAKVPGQFSVPSGDDGGPMTNGGNHEGSLASGDLDMWTFTANAGERVLLRATRLTGNTSWFRPWIRLYGPDGALVASGDSARDQDNLVNVVAGQTGTYTVLMSGYYRGFDGTYRLHFAKIPGTFSIPGGDDGGPLNNGGNHEGTIGVADLDLWTITANAGERILLRATRLTGNTSWFRPHVQVYRADGSLFAQGDAADNHDNGVNFVADETTTYTVLISSYYADYDGTYRLHCLKVPGQFTIPGGDEGGALSNGGNHEGSLTIADMDIFTFTPKAGDRVMLRAGRLTGNTSWFRPWVRVYGPDGTLTAAGDPDDHDNWVDIVSPQTATYTVVISGYYTGYDGSYRLHYLNLSDDYTVPGGDNGGALANGGSYEAALTVADLDPWTVSASAGDVIFLRAGRLTGNTSWFRPWVRLYGPDGTLVASGDIGNADNWISYQVPDDTTYTAVISGYYAGYDGTYQLHFARTPASFTVPGGDDGGPLSRTNAVQGTVTIGDIDIWTFEADQGNQISLRMQELTGGNAFSPSFSVYGPVGQVIGAHVHASLAQVSFVAPDSGLYTIVASSGAAGGTGTYEFSATGLPVQGKQLRVSRTGERGFIINWPGAVSGYVLQHNPVASPEGWQDVDLVPVANTLNTRVTVEMEGNHFFRLRRANP